MEPRGDQVALEHKVLVGTEALLAIMVELGSQDPWDLLDLLDHLVQRESLDFLELVDIL